MLKLVQYRGTSMNIFDNKQQDTKVVRTPEGKVIQWLSEMIDGSRVEGQSLYIEEDHLEIEPHIMQIKNGVAQIAFILKHPLFQEDMIESVVGAGPTSDEAIKVAAIQFVSSVLEVLQKALKAVEGQEVIVKLPEQENQFKLYKSSVKVQGNKKSREAIDYWNLLGEELVKRLGNKRVYFIKMYASKAAEKVHCECRVNGMVYPLFTRILERIARSWEIETEHYAEKQFFVLIQDESTYKPYPLSKKEVEQFVLSSLLLYRQCSSQEAYDEISKKILKACPNPSLAQELLAFIPEVFAEVIFSEAIYLDSAIFIRDGKEIEISKHQLTAYDWIHSIIERTIRAGYYEKEQVDCIISCSASLNCIQQAMKEGSKLENLCTSGIAIPVDETYEIL